MKTIRYLLVTMLFVVATSGCTHLAKNKDVLFQISTINALLEGVYDGEIVYGELNKHGDFGLGTFNALDGEMIGLEGKFYQIKADGIAYAVDDSQKTPFAVVTFFEADKSVWLDKTLNFAQLTQYLDQLIPSPNTFYAVKIEGFFDYILTRSVPRQNKPYPRLVEVVKNQPTFELHKVRGTIIGFRLPKYIEGINVPGYHFHFITEDRKTGGHLLECRPGKVKIEIDYSSELYLVLPKHGQFHKINLSPEKQAELEKIEKKGE